MRKSIASACRALVLALGACTGEVGTSGTPTVPAPGASMPPNMPSMPNTPEPPSPPGGGGAPNTPPVENPGAPATPPVTANCASPGTDTGATVLRRLSGLEYQLTLQDLFALTAPPSLEGIPPDTDKDGFRTFAELQTVSSQHVRAYLDKAHELADALMSDAERRQQVLGCEPAASGCLASFTASFGRLAYRRALSADELTALTTRAIADALDPSDQFRFVIEALLSSPNFLFRVETGDKLEGVATLTPEQLASRLSFALWGRAPSAELLDKAAAGQLSTPAGLSELAGAMLADARARTFFGAFFRQWLGFETLRRPNVAPAGWADSLLPLMQEETDKVVLDHGWGASNILDLLTTNQTRLSPAAATYFGLPAPAADGTVSFPAGHFRENTGLLTHPSLLSMKSDGDPIAIRGNWLRKTFLCQQLTVPASLADEIGERLVGLTRQEIVQSRNTDAACKGCHSMIDPVGVGFAKFDSTGRYDETADIAEWGVTPGLPDAADPGFATIGELSAKLRALPAVSACLAHKAFLYVNGREAADEDACTLDAAGKTFSAGGQSFTSLLKGLVEAPEFRLRRAKAAP
jgi:hypothetical protein